MLEVDQLMNRTKKQTSADQIDWRLDQVARAAERDKMDDLALAIRRARVVARGYMHPDDRAKTE